MRRYDSRSSSGWQDQMSRPSGTVKVYLYILYNTVQASLDSIYKPKTIHTSIVHQPHITVQAVRSYQVYT